MELIRLVDYEDTAHYLNKDFIISIRPWYPIQGEPVRKCGVEYGTGFVDCVYMKETASEVAGMIAGIYFK